jgi:hypothetical protein
LAKLVRLVKSRDHATQAELATALGVSTGTMTTLKRQAVARGMISLDEWRDCLRESREMREDAAGSDAPF